MIAYVRTADNANKYSYRAIVRVPMIAPPLPLQGGILRRFGGSDGSEAARERGVFYPVFAVFMLLVVVFTAAATVEYGAVVGAGQRAGVGYLVGAVVLLALAVWWLTDAARGTPPTTLPQVLRAVAFVLVAGPVLSPPAFARLQGGVRAIGRTRRVLWRPASILGVVMIVLWFLS